MGRRSINTTKSGKYMNPTDQARKEARKKELKKNRKQRQMVRAAVLKGKDPSQLIVEMDKMDMIEFNVENQPSLSDKVVTEKRKKLKETLDRVMKLYEKEDPSYWVELRQMEVEYDKKRLSRMQYYDAVRHAQAVTVDEIPLPMLDMPAMPEAHQEPLVPKLPNLNMMPPQSILKRTFIPPCPVDPRCGPGCPPFQPPELSDDEMDDGGDDPMTGVRPEDGEDMEARQRTIRFADCEDGPEKDTRATIKKGKNLTSLQAKLLQMSGQDIDEFMRESEVLFREKEAEKQADLKARLGRLGDEPNLQQPPPPLRVPGPPPGPPPPMSQVPPSVSGIPSNDAPGSGIQLPLAPPGVAPAVIPGVPPPMMMRPPPRPGPPPHPVHMPPAPPPQAMFKRLPPPPPMRPHVRPVPGSVGLHAPSLPMSAPPPGHNPNVLTAGPQLITRPKDDDKCGATIEAKAQIRDLSADVTRFMPTALRIKRDDKKTGMKFGKDTKEIQTFRPEGADRRPTKDDAYLQFMRELEDLM